jgi:hypothetical protein
MANNTDLFDSYFRRADLDGDGQISGAEAVGFFQGSSLPKQVLAQVSFISLFSDYIISKDSEFFGLVIKKC